MKAVTKETMNVFLWILCIFFLSGTLVYFPSISAFLSLITSLLLMPIENWQNLISRFLSKKAKIITTCILIFLVFSTIPDTENTSAPPENSGPSAAVKSTSTFSPEHTNIPTKTPISTPSSTPTRKPTATPAPTAKPTATPTPIPTPKSTAKTTPRPTATTTPNSAKTYIINISSGKFHKPSCIGVKNMSEKNKREFNGTRDQLIRQGYDPCGICHP